MWGGWYGGCGGCAWYGCYGGCGGYHDEPVKALFRPQSSQFSLLTAASIGPTSKLDSHNTLRCQTHTKWHNCDNRLSPHQPNLIITRPGYLLKAIFGDIVSYDRTCCGRLWSEAILAADIPPSQGPQPNGPSDQTFELPFASMPRSSKKLSSETLCLEFLLMKHTQTHKHVHTHTPQRWKMSRIWRIYPCKKIVKYG